ncbi:flagellin [Phaeovulum sp. NW3]|uniref:flagellin n=1 Tax=Phaeovulum sp. NW3 TaxID=2934933 RepID=UPI0020228DDB|nr:flagellin [Phaeovulum sp. NW3]MCL7465258.1 flagellin [Phaeovulum sp. NW3]
MSSILTNTSAMVALQTLKGINSGLAKTQSEISTGKSVNSAKDNAAVWAISKVMESDVKGFSGISDSLALGESTVAVARKASETITDLLTQMKGKIVAAQEDNVDREKIQTDITALKDQIASVVGAAQFNGLNLVDGSSSADILSSLNRDSSGNVTASKISVAGVNFAQDGYTAKDVFAGSTGVSTSGDSAAGPLNAAGGTANIVINGAASPALAAGDKLNVAIGGKTATYTVTDDDLAQTDVSDAIAAGLKTAIDSLGVEGISIDFDAANDQLVLTNDGTTDLSFAASFKNAGSGDLAKLDTIDVTDASTLGAQLVDIETMIDGAIKAAADFGSAESRIGAQAEFISNLTDSLKAGIGAMVDADMEEASARLQALQTQQQLGIQSLSIANQQPQNILSLFR